jgi:hypothetical protein
MRPVAVICRVWRALGPPLWGVLSWCLVGCQPTPTPASPASAAALLPPGAPTAPRPSITGCVESAELKRYVLALDAQRSEARRSALAALGATAEVRAAELASGATTLGLDHTFEAGGKRWVVAAQVAPGFAPEARLASVGNLIHRIEERPRAFATPLLACGVRRCLPSQHTRSAPLAVRSVLIELQPGERWAGPLVVSYDYWWADVSYDRVETCAPGQLPAPRQPQPRLPSSATP